MPIADLAYAPAEPGFAPTSGFPALGGDCGRRGSSLSTASAAEPAGKVEFNRDIRPILSDKCFVCHGPDHASRKADLRLDQREQALADRGGYRAIVPGRAADSELMRRVTSDDADEQMPPAKSGLRLSAREIELLGRWIDQGAEYQPHWSLIPPQQPARADDRASGRRPRTRSTTSSAARLAAAGLKPSPEADKTTLIRRVTFDLTGLPPTPAEVDAFLADTFAAGL